uniref:Uncharacterized protein n=1 Tax=Equus caballus TaxID=9796 RepID=A0A9L0RZ68_HORSE
MDGLGQERDIGYVDNPKVDSKNVTDRMTFTTKSCSQNFIVLHSNVQTIVIGYESCEFLVILRQLALDTLPVGRSELFTFNPDFFQQNSLCT